MRNLTLHLGDDSFNIPKKSVLVNSDFFDLHPELYDNPAYDVEADVEVDDFQTFLNFLRTPDESLITAENRRPLQALGDEFAVSRLIEICSELETAEVTQNLVGRLLAVEEAVAQQTQSYEAIGRDLAQTLSEFVSAELRELRNEIEMKLSAICASQAEMRAALDGLRDDFGSGALQIPMKQAESFRILRRPTAEMSTRRELSQSLRSRDTQRVMAFS
jgi:hypothetical protein